MVDWPGCSQFRFVGFLCGYGSDALVAMDAHNRTADFHCASHSPVRAKAGSSLRSWQCVLVATARGQRDEYRAPNNSEPGHVCFGLLLSSLGAIELRRNERLGQRLWPGSRGRRASVVGAAVHGCRTGLRTPSIDLGKDAGSLCAGWHGRRRCQRLPHVPRTLNYKNSPRLVATQWTLLFWLGFVASLGVVASAFIFYVRRSRSP